MSRRTLGVVGTLVWDRIVGCRCESGPLEAWGGIGYALAALSASLSEEWTARPIVKVGADFAESGMRFVGEMPDVDASAMLVTSEPNNRVEIRYDTDHRRNERLTGGVPAWIWAELEPRVASCDALYVNFISGFEMRLETARALAKGFDGPIYADLHSLFLGKAQDGRRIPRKLRAWADWVRCFDAVQLNEDELGLLGSGEDPWRRAGGVLGEGPLLITVTLGTRGAAYLAAPTFASDPLTWGECGRRRQAEACQAGTVPLTSEVRTGDPTGCGDVWGATTFARLLSGDSLEVAMAEGNRLGSLNVEHRGAGGLYDHFVRFAGCDGSPTGGLTDSAERLGQRT